ncbi:MAG: hypothetical protein PUE80_06580 [bacterium]|nr:hypothetical protein [bacterium]
MNKFFTIIALCAALLLAGACKKQAKHSDSQTAMLQQLAEKINSEKDTTYQNGTKLVQCEYKAGDSLFVYHIQVDDNRFDNVAPDSLKMSIGANVHLNVVANVLAKNHVGLKYEFTTPDNKIEVVFTPEELAEKTKEPSQQQQNK